MWSSRLSIVLLTIFRKIYQIRSADKGISSTKNQGETNSKDASTAIINDIKIELHEINLKIRVSFTL